MQGAAQRVPPKVMTAMMALLLGLLPLMCSTGTGPMQ